MRITIAERLLPYTHLAGSVCIVPRTTLRLRVYPALLRIEDLAGPEPEIVRDIPLNVEGPVKDFTVIQDLEKERVSILGHAKNGYFRYRCFAGENGTLIITIEKEPSADFISFDLKGIVRQGNTLMIKGGKSKPAMEDAPKMERLSLGSHKAQDWELIKKRRHQMEEIFPIWLSLGQMCPLLPVDDRKGTLVFLDREAMDRLPPEHILPAFEKFYLAAFEGMLSPRLKDTDHQGFSLPSIPAGFTRSPLPLLDRGAELIRRLFFREENRSLYILPQLPLEFHSGRFLGLKSAWGLIDMEWSKKKIRRLIVHSQLEGSIQFKFHGVKRYRVRLQRHEKGKCHLIGQELAVKAGLQYWLDNFEN